MIASQSQAIGVLKRAGRSAAAMVLAMVLLVGAFRQPAQAVPVSSPPPDIDLFGGQHIAVGTLDFEVLFTPGHSPGGVTFYEPSEGVAFDGDLLFSNGIGRTDLFGGNFETLMHSIKEVLFALPDDTVIYPGHGPKTTVGREKRSNPWIR